MNSRRAKVTASFFVRAPLTVSASWSSSGSIPRFVAMTITSPAILSAHTLLHTVLCETSADASRLRDQGLHVRLGERDELLRAVDRQRHPVDQRASTTRR